VLITRSNPRAPELQWLRQQGAVFPGVTIEWFGRDWLDSQAAGREDVISYMQGEDYKLLKRARDLGLEQAAAATGSDLLSRYERLRRQGDEISPFWRWDVSTTSNGTALQLSAKRPDAAAVFPISLTPTFTFSPDDAEAVALAGQLVETLAVGGDVDIPGRYIKTVAVQTSSEATARLLGERPERPNSLRIVSVPDTTGLPLLVDVEVQRDGSRVADPLRVVLTERIGGIEGSTLRGADAAGVLTVAMVIPLPGSQHQGALRMELRPLSGRRPYEVEPVLRWMTGLTPEASLVVTAGGLHLATFIGGGQWSLRAVHRLVSALAILQRHTTTPLTIPRQLPDGSELCEILDAAQALSGSPARQSFDGIDAKIHRGMPRGFLETMPAEPGGLYIGADFEVLLDGRSVAVGDLALWAPHVTLDNRAELEAVSVDIVDHTAHFPAAADTGFSLIRGVDNPGEVWTPVQITPAVSSA